ncbi:MAG: amino acid ABC transporter permease [Pseudomonadota bacterium]
MRIKKLLPKPGGRIRPVLSSLTDVMKFILVLGALSWFLIQGTERLGYNWQWYRVPRYIFSMDQGRFQAGPLLEGLAVTLHITWISLLLSFAVGLVTALLRLSDSLAGRLLARGYLEVIRNTPLLVQILFIYFVLSPVFGFSRFASGVLALSLFEGAYASEIFRAGIVSIHKGQWEASYSLGLSTFNTYRHVILPQMIRRIIPPLTGQGISLIKDSALVSTIAIYDLTMQGRAIIAETYLTFELWFAMAGIYLLMTLALSFAVSAMEDRLRMKTAL